MTARIYSVMKPELRLDVHSVKLRLRDNEYLDALGIDAEKAAHLLIDEAIRRSLVVLRNENALSAEFASLTVSINVGCTPAFNLTQRLRLRDICLGLGLTVRLVNLVEEPVAAAFELGLSGAASQGRMMVIDIGGGTLDVAVLRMGASSATRGSFASTDRRARRSLAATSTAAEIQWSSRSRRMRE